MFYSIDAKDPERMKDLYAKYDYSLLSAGDVISNMINELNAKIFYIGNSGKIRRNQDDGMDHNTPWIFMNRSPERNCLLWHRIMFSIFGMLPIWCRLHCWKVVVRPRTLEELFLLKELQEGLKLPSKLGMEVRRRVHGQYGGYFYTNSKEEGFDRLDLVRKEIESFIAPVSSNPNEGIPVYLKLACTEFEHRFGPTDQYRPVTDIDRQNEDAINGCFESPSNAFIQPKHLRDHICQEWIHFAWDRGDPTVARFNKNKPLFPDVVKYNRPSQKNEILFRKFK